MKNCQFSKFLEDWHQLCNATNCCKVAILMCVLGVEGGGDSISGEVKVVVVVVLGRGEGGCGRLLVGGIVVVAGLVTAFVRVAAVIAVGALFVWWLRWWWW